ncbi:MAG TPA: periplasmic heavy metal sensor [candidate division WOR-3 bacterium]|uniref:Periplasmic heavy metal sensor n=1 Tax=candidate division WOR-3 bacterium TaxID=2052148 RepID=A0A7V0T6Z9_UNCW3|nr:periplasmic heavy metal sensor [candidate division WOR-3 bacterium]
MTKYYWLLVALAVSLALNAGAIGASVWHRFRRWDGERRFYRELRHEKRERISHMLCEHESEMDSLREEHFRARRALARLGDAEEPGPAAVDSLLDRLASVHREMNRVAFTTGREVFRFFPDKRRAREHWEWMHRRGPGRPPHRGPRGDRHPRFRPELEPPPEDRPDDGE